MTHILTSSRNDSYFRIPNFDLANTTLIPSDTLQSWDFNAVSGQVELRQLGPSWGLWPRQFAVNAKGDLVAVALQDSGMVVIVERDIGTGEMGQPVAGWVGDGQVNCVVWDE